MSQEKEKLIDFCQGFSQLTIKYFLERSNIQSSNFYTGNVSIHKLRKLKKDIIEKFEELENVYNVNKTNSL